MVKLLKPDQLQDLLKTLLLKITNAENNHNGFSYQPGMNYLKGSFSFYGECVPGGFYFIEIQKILDYLLYGVNIRIVRLDKMMEDPSFKIIRDSEKYRSNVIFLEESMSLSDPFTYEFLRKAGVDIEAGARKILRHAIKYGFIEIVRYLYELIGSYKMNSHICPSTFSYIVKKGNEEIYDYIISKKYIGYCIPIFYLNEDDRRIIGKNNTSLLKRLVEDGIVIFGNKSYCFQALIRGNVELFLYLKSIGHEYSVSMESNTQLMYALMIRNSPEMFEKVGIDISKIDSHTLTDCILKAISFSNEPMIDFLMGKCLDDTVFRSSNRVLITAVECNDLRLVKKILSIEDLQHTNSNINLQQNIIIIAYMSHCYDVAEFLIDYYIAKGADLVPILELTLMEKIHDLNITRILMERGIDYRKFCKEIFHAIINNPLTNIEFFAKYEGIITQEHIDGDYTSNNVDEKDRLKRKLAPFISYPKIQCQFDKVAEVVENN